MSATSATINYAGMEMERLPDNPHDAPMPDVHPSLIEHIARNEHMRWADRMFKEGWTCGATYDYDGKTDPGLVPYDMLTSHDHDAWMFSATMLLKTLNFFGIAIDRYPITVDSMSTELRVVPQEFNDVINEMARNKHKLASSLALFDAMRDAKSIRNFREMRLIVPFDELSNRDKNEYMSDARSILEDAISLGVGIHPPKKAS